MRAKVVSARPTIAMFALLVLFGCASAGAPSRNLIVQTVQDGWGMTGEKHAKLVEMAKGDAKQFLQAYKTVNWFWKMDLVGILSEVNTSESREVLLFILRDTCSGETSDWDFIRYAYSPRSKLLRFTVMGIGKQGSVWMPNLEKEIAKNQGDCKRVLQAATGMCGDRKYYQNFLTDLVSHRNPLVRELSANALAVVGGADAKDNLERATDDPFFIDYANPGHTGTCSLSETKSYPVREAAEEALRQIASRTKQR